MTEVLHPIWIDRTPPTGVDLPPDAVLVDSLALAHAAIVGSGATWGDEMLARHPLLRVVARAGIGYDNVDLDACTRHGVAACNAPDAPTISTAEHALALILAVAKNLGGGADALRRGTVDFAATNRAIELEGLTLGMVGCGRIGSRVTRYADALGMHVLVHDPYIDSVPVGRLVSLAEIWAASDVISLHAPALPTTRHIVGPESISAMKRGVVIVNCARGALIDHGALLSGLESGHVAGAGLDVTDPEPLPADHPLLHRPDVLVTPHVASATTIGRRRLVSDAIVEAMTWLRGGQPPHLLNLEVLGSGRDRRKPSPAP